MEEDADRRKLESPTCVNLTIMVMYFPFDLWMAWHVGIKRAEGFNPLAQCVPFWMDYESNSPVIAPFSQTL